MLLRLRQICVHPALIQESCEALIASDELNGERDLNAERMRAARLVSADFVSKLRRKYKESALTRMRAEREVNKSARVALYSSTDCPLVSRCHC
jgi:hypothetical protein